MVKKNLESIRCRLKRNLLLYLIAKEEKKMVSLQQGPVPKSRAISLAIKQGLRDVFTYAGRSLVIILTVAVGVALGIAIIAVANGVDDQVNSLLHVRFLPPVINVSKIQQTLDQSRTLLTYLVDNLK